MIRRDRVLHPVKVVQDLRQPAGPLRAVKPEVFRLDAERAHLEPKRGHRSVRFARVVRAKRTRVVRYS
eukprot:31178-Pelagococcus_subviridis.AAC.4